MKVEQAPRRFTREIEQAREFAGDAGLWQAVMTGAEWAPDLPTFAHWTVRLIGWRTWDRWPPIGAPDLLMQLPSTEQDPGLSIVRIVVEHPRRRGWIEWTRGDEGHTVESRGWADAPDADLKALLQARALVDHVQQRIGRLAGYRAMPRKEFLDKLRPLAGRIQKGELSQQAVAAHLNIGKTTFQEYLAAEGPRTWERLKAGIFPPD